MSSYRKSDDFTFKQMSGAGITWVTLGRGGTAENSDLIATVNFGPDLRGNIQTKRPPDSSNYSNKMGVTSLKRKTWEMIEIRVDENGKIAYLLNDKIEAEVLSYFGATKIASDRPIEQLTKAVAGPMYGLGMKAGSWYRVGPVIIEAYATKSK